MHPHDQAIEHFQALQPQRFTWLVRFDLREHFSLTIFEREVLLQLWLRAADEQKGEKPFLRLACFGVERGKDFGRLWPLYSLPVQLKIQAIRQYQLRDIFFEVMCFDDSYDSYDTLFTCRHFEVNLEETCE